MFFHQSSSTSEVRSQFSDDAYEKLKQLLRPRVARWVMSSRIPIWYTQRSEVIADIVQEAISRTFTYAHRAEHGEVAPVDSLEHLGITIAYHCFVDAQRRDHRYISLMVDTTSDRIDLLEVAVNNMLQTEIFDKIAEDISCFPLKQREALLIDLANRMYFDVQPTPLQGAFLKVGICLEAYQRALPLDPVMYQRHSSLVHAAYKRLARVPWKHLYTLTM